MKREWIHRTRVRQVDGLWFWSCLKATCPAGIAHSDFATAYRAAWGHASIGGCK